MKRALAITSLVLVALVGGTVLAGPRLAQLYAEAQVDKALARIRVQTTSVANRGEVAVDLGARAVTVQDLSVESARREQRVTIRALTIVGPRTSGDLLTAERVVFDDVAVRSAGETITVPRVEIQNYSGPERGLTATPGVGRNARSQADIIALISLERAVAPSVTFSGDASGLKRTLRNVSVNRVVRGAVESATIDGVAFDVPYLPAEQSPQTSSLAISAGPIVYEGVNLPTLWRFYASDGSGDRQPFLKSAVVANATAVATLRPGGVLRASWRRLKIEDVELRPLAFPVTAFDVVVSKLREGHPTTPAEIREQLLHAADALRAVSFDRVRLEGASAEIARDGERLREFQIAAAEVGPYADGRLDTVKAERFSLRRDDGLRFALEKADLRGVDLAGLMRYADKVGRDEILMSVEPTAADLVRYAPRLTSAEATGLDAAGEDGEIRARTVKVEVNAPLDAVPQRIAFDLDDLDARPAQATKAARALAAMRLPDLRGGLSFALTLDPNAKTLALSNFDYRFANLGTVKANGELASVDPLLAVAPGAAFVDKFSAIELGTFKVLMTDDGAVETMIRRAADQAQTPVELYREEIARDAQETISRVFGPPAENSAEAVARFIREPRTLEVTVNPRTTAAQLLELIRAADLGPAGIAQVIDVAALYKR